MRNALCTYPVAPPIYLLRRRRGLCWEMEGASGAGMGRQQRYRRLATGQGDEKNAARSGASHGRSPLPSRTTRTVVLLGRAGLTELLNADGIVHGVNVISRWMLWYGRTRLKRLGASTLHHEHATLKSRHSASHDSHSAHKLNDKIQLYIMYKSYYKYV